MDQARMQTKGGRGPKISKILWTSFYDHKNILTIWCMDKPTDNKQFMSMRISQLCHSVKDHSRPNTVFHPSHFSNLS